MVETGVVTKVNGEKAIVSFERRGKCDSCHICSVSKDGRSVYLEIDNTLQANVGDTVTVEISKKWLVAAEIALYALPLVLVGIGVGIGSLLSPLAQSILAVSGFILGLTTAILADRFSLRKRKGYKPTMIDIKTDVE